MATQSESYPARLDIDYPEKLDRLTTFFRLIWAIPILIVLSVISATSSSTVIVVTRAGEVVSGSATRAGGSTSPGSSPVSGPGSAPIWLYSPTGIPRPSKNRPCISRSTTPTSKKTSIAGCRW
jgi:hypothetical protein